MGEVDNGVEDTCNLPQLVTVNKLPSVTEQLLKYDHRLSASLFQYNSGFLRPLLMFLEHTGSGLVWIPGAGALYLSPWKMPVQLRMIFLNFFVASLLDLLVIGVIKSAIQRPRPLYNKGMTLVLSVDVWSFPSGHASRALFTVAFFVLKAPLIKSLGLLADHLDMSLSILSVWGVLTAASRVFLGRHFVLDVVVGSLLGLLEALVYIYYLWIPSSVSEPFFDLLLACSTLQPSCQISNAQSLLTMMLS